MRKSIIAGTMLLVAAPLLAASETKDPAAVAAGTYTVDGSHATVLAKVVHLGFSTTTVRFDQVSGTLTYDPAKAEAAAASITVATGSLNSGFAARDEHLKGPGFFNAAAFPNATFASTRLVKTGADTADLPGQLTLLGVTKPLTLHVKFNGFGKGMDGKTRVGFSATGAIKRSDFGMKTFLGPVADDVALEIDAEFAGK
ncbi:MAG: YceI family protein [Sphingomonadales bacterium]|nr:YceI family protein [Sphingomonadales bacterium]